MPKFHSIAALCGNGNRPELRALFERLAIDPHSGLRIHSDGTIQAGPRFGRTSEAGISNSGWRGISVEGSGRAYL